MDVTRAWIKLEAPLTLITGCYSQPPFDSLFSLHFTTGTKRSWTIVWFDEDGFDVEKAVAENKIYFMLLARGLSNFSFALVIELISSAGGFRCFRRVGFTKDFFPIQMWEKESILLL